VEVSGVMSAVRGRPGLRQPTEFQSSCRRASGRKHSSTRRTARGVGRARSTESNRPVAAAGCDATSDDGCVVMKGKIPGRPARRVALEGAFQGGSWVRSSGAKLTAALDLARADSERGISTAAVLLLETGGVRLQEANLGLAAIAEIMAAILACGATLRSSVLRRHRGCFGGMSLAAGFRATSS